MNLTGRKVRFWLSAEGKQAWARIVKKTQSLYVVVVNEGELGAWVWIPGRGKQEVWLLKWEHFTTASFEYQPEVPQQRPAAGFKP